MRVGLTQTLDAKTMKRKPKVVIGILMLGTISGLLMLAFGVNGPYYRTEVVNLPVNLQSPSEHQVIFTVDRSDEYMIEIHLNNVFTKEKMDKILGHYVSGKGGNINVSWYIHNNGNVIAEGSNIKYGYSPIWGGGHSGLAIGVFSADKEKEYTLNIKTNNTSANWNQTEPYIEIGLHPSKLENYLVLQLFGMLFAVVFGVILVVVVIINFAAKQKQHLTSS